MGTCRIGDKGEIEGDLEEILEDAVMDNPGEIQRDPGRSEGNAGRFWENKLRSIGDIKEGDTGGYRKIQDWRQREDRGRLIEKYLKIRDGRIQGRNKLI
jgi:hypothetical protein